jgi:hypothetical protein
MGIRGKVFRGVVVPGRGFGAQRMANPAVLQAAQRLTNSFNLSEFVDG